MLSLSGCYWLKRPAIAPLMLVAIVPETIERKPSSVISRRRSGTIAPSPPTRMPSEPKFAKPQSAYVTDESGLRAERLPRQFREIQIGDKFVQHGLGPHP